MTSPHVRVKAQAFARQSLLLLAHKVTICPSAIAQTLSPQNCVKSLRGPGSCSRSFRRGQSWSMHSPSKSQPSKSHAAKIPPRFINSGGKRYPVASSRKLENNFSSSGTQPCAYPQRKPSMPPASNTALVQQHTYVRPRINNASLSSHVPSPSIASILPSPKHTYTLPLLLKKAFDRHGSQSLQKLDIFFATQRNFVWIELIPIAFNAHSA